MPLLQARTFVELASGTPCTSVCILPTLSPAAASSDATYSGVSGFQHILAGYASGGLRCFDLAGVCEVWGSVRHPSGVIAVIPHPAEEAVMAASR
jgi:hypothetical protein